MVSVMQDASYWIIGIFNTLQSQISTQLCCYFIVKNKSWNLKQKSSTLCLVVRK